MRFRWKGMHAWIVTTTSLFSGREVCSMSTRHDLQRFRTNTNALLNTQSESVATGKKHTSAKHCVISRKPMLAVLSKQSRPGIRAKPAVLGPLRRPGRSKPRKVCPAAEGHQLGMRARKQGRTFQPKSYFSVEGVRGMFSTCAVLAST